MQGEITTAFVLGAGLGTRLRPLTENLPKPLIPVFQKPLITFAFDHLQAGLPDLQRIIVNTHHQPGAYDRQFVENRYGQTPLIFRNEPVRLETGGGIKNIEDLIEDEEHLLVYNGDILTDLPLELAVEKHLAGDAEVTLILRSGEGPLQITFDEEAGEVRDIRQQILPDREPNAVFTGVYLLRTRFLRRLRLEPESVIPTFLHMLHEGWPIQGVLLDQGLWRDLGTRDTYLDVHRELREIVFPRYRVGSQHWREQVHPTAQVNQFARLDGCSVVGAHSRIAEGVVLSDTIVWPGSEIIANSILSNCIVTGKFPVQGEFSGQDF